MKTIFNLPVEVLAEILCECFDRTMLQTCKTIAVVAFSTSALWTSIRLGPSHFTHDAPNFLRAQILRANGAPLYVFVRTIMEHGQAMEVSEVCGVLKEYNGQIREFQLTAYTAMLAGSFVHAVFPNLKSFPTLEVLSILSERESTGNPLDAVWPRLDLVLADAPTMCPNLRKLHINSFHDTVPMLPHSASFSNLSGLILNGSLENDIPSAGLLATLLHCTPQLESLWLKHFFWENYETVSPPIAQSTFKGRSNISPDIQLPRLKHLAVSIPGPACNLMGCITAPALEDLHLDGSRELRGEEDWLEAELYQWAGWEKKLVYDALKLLALQCPNVRRLAVTDAYLARTTWEWIMCGEDGRQPPFRELKYITLHAVLGTLYTHWGFNTQLLDKFASKPMIPLEMLALVGCNFPLSASSVVKAFQASGAKELKYTGVALMDEERRELEELGVSVIHAPIDSFKREWWTYGHEIDVTDSGVYY
jgi:hypothetical protein